MFSTTTAERIEWLLYVALWVSMTTWLVWRLCLFLSNFMSEAKDDMRRLDGKHKRS